MQIAEERIEEFKEIYKKEYGKELTDEEAREGARSLVELAKILLEQAQIEIRRKTKLETEPKGFPLENGRFYSCLVCGDTANGSDGWWDKWGFKCQYCQRAVENKVIQEKSLKTEIFGTRVGN